MNIIHLVVVKNSFYILESGRTIQNNSLQSLILGTKTQLNLGLNSISHWHQSLASVIVISHFHWSIPYVISICHSNQSLVISHCSSVISYPSLVVSHLSSVISHQLLVISLQSSYGFLALEPNRFQKFGFINVQKHISYQGGLSICYVFFLHVFFTAKQNAQLLYIVLELTFLSDG